jgi:hypothetical protein
MRLSIFATAIVLAASAAAQKPAAPAAPGAGAGNWVVERTPRGVPYVHIRTGTAHMTELALICGVVGTPVLTANFPQHRTNAMPSVWMTAPDGRVGALDIGWVRNSGTIWAVLLRDGTAVDVLAATSPMLDVSVDGQHGSLSLAGSRQAIAEALAGCWEPPASAAARGARSGFTVNVSLSPRAAAELQRRNEGIVVSAMYSGTPTPAHESDGDEISGDIDLGARDVAGPGRAGPIVVPDTVLRRDRLSWITGEPNVLVNIVSARRSGQDNLLDCGLVSGTLANMAARTHHVLCRLFGEP